jgi:quercetin dioxygenase-like cupin family protein
LHEPTLATFIVDYSPGGSAVLHRAPSTGYVLVYVLSGAIRAYAWEAGVGTYRAGETWAEPAFAHDIATTNASAAEPARALVILVTGNAEPSESPE